LPEDEADLLAFGIARAGACCRAVARGGDALLAPLLAGQQRVERWTVAEWREHLSFCPYCRRMAWQHGVRASGLSDEQTGLDRLSPRLAELTARLRPVLSPLAVLFTDLVGSTAHAAEQGALSLRAVMRAHNELLAPLLKEYRGTFVRLIGDAILAFFDDPADAAACAVAMHRRLAEHNASSALPPQMHLHIRAGIHYGRCLVFSQGGGPDLAGLGVNVAARLNEAGKGLDDPIVISEAVRRRLTPGKFATVGPGRCLARGAGEVELHRLLWKPEEIEAAPVAPPGPALSDEDTDDLARTVRAVVLNPYDEPVRVRVRFEGTPGVWPDPNAGREQPEMPALAESMERVVVEALRVLTALGFEGASADRLCVEWQVRVPGFPVPVGALGLAAALATVASFTGADLPGGLATAGTVREGTGAVTGTREMVERLLDDHVSGTVVVPRELSPGDARRGVMAVTTLADAILQLLGEHLGLTAWLFRSALPMKSGSAVWLGVEPDVPRPRRPTRDVGDVARRSEGAWAIHDRLRLVVSVDRPGYLTLLNVGTSGRVNVLLPARYLEPGLEFSFPARDDPRALVLGGPPGCETFVALLSDAPLHLGNERFASLQLQREDDARMLRASLEGAVRDWCETAIQVE
jgi:class 3 adenylate cyclase